ncbi:MAG: sulfatase-like hydrolase/transferase [Ferruginibacter sp.]
MIQLFKKIPFFLFLLVLFFCLNGSAENYGYLNVYEVTEVALIILVCMAVFYAITWLITKNYLFASLVTFFIALWYLFFGAMHDIIKSTSFLQFMQSYTVIIPVLIVINILVIRWIKRKKQLYPKLFLYLNILFLVFCITDGIVMVNKHIKFKQVKFTEPVPFDQTKVTQKPNVYFLLFDEYAGYKSLEDSFGFKNDSLYHFLKQKDFTELPTFANYDFTPFSMSSILNMQYVPENYRKHALTQPDIQQRFGEIRHAQVFSIFKNLGYTIQNNSIFDIKDHPSLYRYNGLFPMHATLLTNKIFHKRLIKDIGWWFVTGKFEISYLKNMYLYRKDDYNVQVEQKIMEAAASRPAEPTFFYGHLFLPHGQFYRDSTGAFNRADKILDLKYLEDKSLYLSYLKYTNKVIEKLVNKIVDSDPAAAIIIISDHGFYDYASPGDYDPYNFDVICFLRIPGAKPDSSNLPRSNVNFFRYLFNSAYGQNLPYLKDSTVFVTEDPAVLR